MLAQLFKVSADDLRERRFHLFKNAQRCFQQLFRFKQITQAQVTASQVNQDLRLRLADYRTRAIASACSQHLIACWCSPKLLCHCPDCRGRRTRRTDFLSDEPTQQLFSEGISCPHAIGSIRWPRRPTYGSSHTVTLLISLPRLEA